MTVGGQLFVLPTLERLIDVSVFSLSVGEESLLRTPAAVEGDGGAQSARVKGAKGGMLMLRDQIYDLTNDLLPTPTVGHLRNHDEDLDGYEQRRQDYRDGKTLGMPGPSLGVVVRQEIDLMPTPNTMDFMPSRTAEQKAVNKGKGGYSNLRETVINEANTWGKFEPAIRRWEIITGRPAPAPTKPDGKDGTHRLSSLFTEWMMGLPEGWITDCGLTRNEELKACGNGVVPQQAEAALRELLDGLL